MILLTTMIAFLPACTPQLRTAATFSYVSERDQPEQPLEIDSTLPVREQNCARPIENSGGNLRCK